MHDRCMGCFQNGKQVADQVRMMGYDKTALPVPFEIDCTHCNAPFQMETMVAACPSCNMVYAVTPCHSHSKDYAMPAGVGY